MAPSFALIGWAMLSLMFGPKLAATRRLVPRRVTTYTAIGLKHWRGTNGLCAWPWTGKMTRLPQLLSCRLPQRCKSDSRVVHLAALIGEKPTSFGVMVSALGAVSAGFRRGWVEIGRQQHYAGNVLGTMGERCNIAGREIAKPLASRQLDDGSLSLAVLAAKGAFWMDTFGSIEVAAALDL